MVQIIRRIFNYTGYAKPVLAMYVLHNLQEQMSQCNIYNFSLNVHGEVDSLISAGIRFDN